MNKQIEILNNKHLGIIFQPRSGSHVLREYMCKLLNRENLHEFFNPRISLPEISIENNIVKQIGSVESINPRPYAEEKSSILNKIEILQNLSNNEKYGVASIYSAAYPKYYQKSASSLLELIAQQQNIQFIELDRADVLYSIISLFISAKTDVFHNTDQQMKLRSNFNLHMDMTYVEEHLQTYIDNKNLTKQHFENIPIIYYEQYQNKITNILNLFTGIPKKIVGLGINKFKGNHKELISNINEVEDYYEEFVNKHSEYFPQYFDKLPAITIPASQGRQPKILLPEYS